MALGKQNTGPENRGKLRTHRKAIAEATPTPASRHLAQSDGPGEVGGDQGPAGQPWASSGTTGPWGGPNPPACAGAAVHTPGPASGGNSGLAPPACLGWTPDLTAPPPSAWFLGNPPTFPSVCDPCPVNAGAALRDGPDGLGHPTPAHRGREALGSAGCHLDPCPARCMGSGARQQVTVTGCAPGTRLGGWDLKVAVRMGKRGHCL